MKIETIPVHQGPSVKENGVGSVPDIIDNIVALNDSKKQTQSIDRRMLPIAEICMDASMQIRAAIHEETVNDYAERLHAGDQFPPVVVYFDTAKYLLADGFHRVAAAVQAGRNEISAEVRTGTKRDALIAALGANIQHGLRRSNADKRRAVEIAVKEFAGFSDHKIAEMCGVGNHLVGDVRKELGDSPSSRITRIGRDGKLRRSNPQCKRKKRVETKGSMQTSKDKAAAINDHAAPPSTTVAKNERPDEELILIHLADGTDLALDVLAEGWIDKEWVTGRLRTFESIAKPVTAIEKQRCALYQRMVIGMASVLNREVGNTPSPDVLENVEEALGDIRNLTVTHNSYKRAL